MKSMMTNSLAMITCLVAGLWLVMAAWAAASPPTGNMVLIPAGEFNMGDPYKEGLNDELPAHKIYISAFYIEKYLVTGKQWKDVYDWAEAHRYDFDNTGESIANDHPVQTVSWYDVVKWLNARSEKEGRTPAYYMDVPNATVYRKGKMDLTKDMVKWTSNGYRLPTEAEWEKAARGGLDGHHYPWPGKGGNYKDHIDCGKTNYDDCNKGGTTPVGNYVANGYGLYDLGGNVWGWVWDWYDSGWYGKTGATSGNTRGPDSGSNRVLRGSCWINSSRSLRCSFRFNYNPTDPEDYIGFRATLGQP
ncbi:MAG: SUMF1/EgtB/PvdO family nonheme iron enzyme [Deltaproteobacteria bacterium]|nr:SUMF1/EgtB/PvdO family nonheme iron enzyme [Deltaproteobacteria bacterium]